MRSPIFRNTVLEFNRKFGNSKVEHVYVMNKHGVPKETFIGEETSCGFRYSIWDTLRGNVNTVHNHPTHHRDIHTSCFPSNIDLIAFLSGGGTHYVCNGKYIIEVECGNPRPLSFNRIAQEWYDSHKKITMTNSVILHTSRFANSILGSPIPKIDQSPMYTNFKRIMNSNNIQISITEING